MTAKDRELVTFINQMPPEMKQDAIKGLEFLRGMTIAEYKEQQIKAAEALITDIQNNPANYTTAILNDRFPDILGYFEISDDLNRRIEIIKHFISHRSGMVFHTDGSIEEHKNATYEEYINSDKHRKYLEFTASKKK